MEKITGIIQAYPMRDKNFKDLQSLLCKLTASGMFSQIILCIPEDDESPQLNSFVSNYQCKIFKGDKEDIPKRLYEAAKANNASIVGRILSTSQEYPIWLMRKMIYHHIKNGSDYTFMEKVENTTFCFPLSEIPPINTLFEIVSFNALKRLLELPNDKRIQDNYIKFASLISLGPQIKITPFQLSPEDLNHILTERFTEFFPFPKTLAIEPTNSCNLRCLMCPIWGSYNYEGGRCSKKKIVFI